MCCLYLLLSIQSWEQSIRQFYPGIHYFIHFFNKKNLIQRSIARTPELVISLIMTTTTLHGLLYIISHTSTLKIFTDTWNQVKNISHQSDGSNALNTTQHNKLHNPSHCAHLLPVFITQNILQTYATLHTDRLRNLRIYTTYVQITS